MFFRNKNILRLFLTSAIVFGFLSGRCHGAQANLKFVIGLDKAKYKPAEPISASLKIENNGREAVYVNKRFYLCSEGVPKDKRDVYLIVISPSGAKLDCKFSYEAGLPKTDYFTLLKPGEEVSSEYKRNLAGFFDFNEPGTYKITAVYENAFGEEIGIDAFKDKLVSQPATIKIVKEEPDNAKIKEK